MYILTESFHQPSSTFEIHTEKENYSLMLIYCSFQWSVHSGVSHCQSSNMMTRYSYQFQLNTGIYHRFIYIHTYIQFDNTWIIGITAIHFWYNPMFRFLCCSIIIFFNSLYRCRYLFVCCYRRSLVWWDFQLANIWLNSILPWPNSQPHWPLLWIHYGCKNTVLHWLLSESTQSLVYT